MKRRKANEPQIRISILATIHDTSLPGKYVWCTIQRGVDWIDKRCLIYKVEPGHIYAMCNPNIWTRIVAKIRGIWWNIAIGLLFYDFPSSQKEEA